MRSINLDDVDAILAAMVMAEDERRPLQGMEAIAVRAILSLSRTGSRTAVEDARTLMGELSDSRRGNGDKLQAIRLR